MFPSSGNPRSPSRRETDAKRRGRPQPASAPQPARHQHRERDFGIGYGNSSGYGCEEHYVRPWGADRFRCV